MSKINPNCDGSHCRGDLEVRVYPLGAGGNLILCQACFAHENRYRYERAKASGREQDWPQVKWPEARRYPEDRS